jgi:hypothetical protein
LHMLCIWNPSLRWKLQMTFSILGYLGKSLSNTLILYDRVGLISKGHKLLYRDLTWIYLTPLTIQNWCFTIQNETVL